MSKQTILHVGIAKSGTTSLQHNLFAETDKLLFIGKPYPDRWVRGEIEKLKWHDSVDLDLTNLKAHVKTARKNAETKGVPLMLSEESLTSPPMKTQIAQRLHEVFGDAKVILTLRNQFDSVVSYNTRQGRTLKKAPDPWAGRYVSFDNWFKHCQDQFPGSHLDRIRYHEMLDIYAGVFGKDNVYPLLFEDMVKDPARFARQLETITGIPSAEIQKQLKKSPANTRTSARTRQAQRYQSSIPSPLRRAAGVLPGPVKSMIRQAASRTLQGGKNDAVTLTAESKETIRNLYAGGNQAVVEEWGLDLEKAGYPL